MQKFVIGNWKMNTTRVQAKALAEGLVEAFSLKPSNACIVVCPPFVYLESMSTLLKQGSIYLGAQDCHGQEGGAFTGDVAAAMLKEVGCSYVIVGHSERRHYHGETDDIVRDKAKAALLHGITPIVCVGEPLEIRETGQVEAYVVQQLQKSMPTSGDFLVAYEPIWAIGTGRVPTLDQIEMIHDALKTASNGMPILYGGSVNGQNAATFAASSSIQGVLVGGASLKAEEFITIAHAFSSEDSVSCLT